MANGKSLATSVYLYLLFELVWRQLTKKSEGCSLKLDKLEILTFECVSLSCIESQTSYPLSQDVKIKYLSMLISIVNSVNSNNGLRWINLSDYQFYPTQAGRTEGGHAHHNRAQGSSGVCLSSLLDTSSINFSSDVRTLGFWLIKTSLSLIPDLEMRRS